MVDAGADEGSDATLGTRLGRVGVWIGGYGPPANVDLDIVGEIEALGFGAFWFGEAPGGREPFVRGDDAARRHRAHRRGDRDRQHLGRATQRR